MQMYRSGNYQAALGRTEKGEGRKEERRNGKMEIKSWYVLATKKNKKYSKCGKIRQDLDLGRRR